MSNRNDFQEMREWEAQESPVIEREEEREPKVLSNLEKRVYAYEAKVLRNRVKRFGLDRVIAYDNRQRTKIETRPLHNHAKPLTAMQKLYNTSTVSKEAHNKNMKNLKDGMQKLRSKSRGI